MTVTVPRSDGTLEQKVVTRGLRLKMGLDTGDVLGSVHPITGRVQYRGKVMNRAARIASAATSGQVCRWRSNCAQELCMCCAVAACQPCLVYLVTEHVPNSKATVARRALPAPAPAAACVWAIQAPASAPEDGL
jgi:hypothetical protein